MRFTKLREDGDGSFSLVSRPFHNGDFRSRLVIRVEDMGEAWDRNKREFPERYMVDLYCVSPEAAGPEALAAAMNSWGVTPADLPADKRARELAETEILHSYGTYARFGGWSGNNLRALLKDARREARLAFAFTFGFKMDSYQNRIGASGWDTIRGILWPGMEEAATG